MNCHALAFGCLALCWLSFRQFLCGNHLGDWPFSGNLLVAWYSLVDFEMVGLWLDDYLMVDLRVIGSGLDGFRVVCL